MTVDLLEGVYEVAPAVLVGYLFAVAIQLCERLTGNDSAVSRAEQVIWSLPVPSIELLYPGGLGLDTFIVMLSALVVYVAWRQRLRDARIYRAMLRRKQKHTDAR